MAKTQRRERHSRVGMLGHKVADKLAKTRHLPSHGVHGASGIFMRRRERGINTRPPQSDESMSAPTLLWRAKREGISQLEWDRHADFMRAHWDLEDLRKAFKWDYDGIPVAEAVPFWGKDVPGLDYSYRQNE